MAFQNAVMDSSVVPAALISMPRPPALGLSADGPVLSWFSAASAAPLNAKERAATNAMCLIMTKTPSVPIRRFNVVLLKRFLGTGREPTEISGHLGSHDRPSESAPPSRVEGRPH